MARDNIIETILTAKDEASAKVGLQLELFSQMAGKAQASATQASAGLATLTTATNASEVGFGRAARAVRALAIPMASELAPAAGQVTGQIVGVITSAALLGSGLGAVAIAAAGLAGIIGGRLIESYQKAEKAQRDFSIAVREGDIQALRAQGKALITDVEPLVEARDRDAGAQARRRAAGFAPNPFLSGSNARAIEKGFGGAADRQRAAESIARDDLMFIEAPKQAKAITDKEAAEELEAIRARNRLIAEGSARQIELTKQLALAGVQAQRQLAEADPLAGIATRQAAVLKAIEETRRLELKAIDDVAAERRKSIEATRSPTMRTELDQLGTDTGLLRRQAEEKAARDVVDANRKAADDQRQLAEQLFQIRRTLGEATLAEEIARYQKIAQAAEAGSRAQIDAAGRVAAAQVQVREQARSAFESIIQAQEAADKGKSGDGTPQVAGPFGELTKGIRLSDFEQQSRDARESLRNAKTAQGVLLAGGTISAAEARAIQNIPNLEALSSRTGDDVVRAMGGKLPGDFVDNRPGGKESFFRGVDRGAPGSTGDANIRFSTEPGADSTAVKMQETKTAAEETKIAFDGVRDSTAKTAEHLKAIKDSLDAIARDAAPAVASAIADLLSFGTARNGGR